MTEEDRLKLQIEMLRKLVADREADNSRLRAAIKERKEFCEMLCGRGWQVAELLESKP